MVIRVIAFGKAQLRRSRSLLSVKATAALFTALVSLPPLAAQDPPAGQPTAGPTQPAPAIQAEAPTYGKIVADGTAVRCWPGSAAQPPVFEDVFAKDQVVAVGRSENGFRAVVLPLGPVGYVSRKFTEVAPDGTVKTKGTKVAFRYRMRSSEAPVTQLNDGTALHVIGEEPDWYRVRVPSIEAWVAEADVMIGDQADGSLAVAYGELKSRHEGEVKARLEQIAAAKKQEEQNKLDLAAVQLVQESFAAEMNKPVAEQNYDAIDAALEQLKTTLAAASAGQPLLEDLKKRIDTQRWIAEATAVRDAKPAPVAGPTVLPKDQLERFQSIGWLRYERRLGGPGIYYLEKGGRRQYLVSCNSGRYDLALFVDREVGIGGPRRRPAAESLSVLDAERLEVLGVIAR